MKGNSHTYLFLLCWSDSKLARVQPVPNSETDAEGTGPQGAHFCRRVAVKLSGLKEQAHEMNEALNRLQEGQQELQEQVNKLCQVVSEIQQHMNEEKRQKTKTNTMSHTLSLLGFALGYR